MKKFALYLLALCAGNMAFAQGKASLPFSIVSLEAAIAEQTDTPLEKHVFFLHDVDKDGRKELFVKEKVRYDNTYYAFVVKADGEVELVFSRTAPGVEEFGFTKDGFLVHYEEHTGGLTNQVANYKLKNSKVVSVACMAVDMTQSSDDEVPDMVIEYSVNVNGNFLSSKESDYKKYSPKGESTSLYNIDGWESFPDAEIEKLNKIRATRPEVKEVYGDLNKNGRSDKVVVETPRNKEHMLVREGDGYEYNFNRPVLKIYFLDENADFDLYQQYDNVLPHPQDEAVIVDMNVSITDKGVLKIDASNFAAMGSYDSSDHSYLYRFQNGDFYLIGEQHTEFARNTGEYTTVSINYSTSKKQTTKGNKFNNKKPVVTWSDLPKKNLEKLGERDLNE